jgi:S-DNA-T family DNA segregation ATPase FtsK/SpoIIIE
LQLTLVSGDAIFSLPLPDKVSGQYWVGRQDGRGHPSDLVSVEGTSDGWVLKSNKRAWLVDRDGHKLREQLIGEDEYFEVVVGATSERLLLRCEPSTEDRKTYAKYIVPAQGTVVIGRSEGCDIRFESGFVSSRHAELEFDAHGAAVRDLQSANGTFVNSRRVSSARLSPGDVVSLFGMNIVVARGLVALNDPDGRVTVGSRVLRPLPRQTVRSVEDDEIEESSPASVFYRSPRFKRDIVTATFTIDPPPQLNDPEEMPMIMVMGPALTMGVASLFMGIFAIANVLGGRSTLQQALPSLVISLSMMVGMILWPNLTRRYERERRVAREQRRQSKYRAYIEQMRQAIEAERRSQSEILHVSITTLEDCVDLIRSRARSLWERTASHNDFLRFRLGLGAGEFDAEIKYAPRKFTLDDDDLQDVMLALAEAPKTLPNVPIALSLLEHPVVGIIGDRELTGPLLAGMLTQLVALHSYDELKLVVIHDPAQKDDWDYLRWLPHTWTDDHSIRFVATTHDRRGCPGCRCHPPLRRACSRHGDRSQERVRRTRTQGQERPGLQPDRPL